ncbi:unnamed protein product [Victoria cruziana]
MRIRNSRNPIDVLPTIKTGPSPAVHAPLSGAFPAERSRPQAAAAPELGVCSVNKSPWDVTPLVLDFFHADGLLHLHQQRCPSGHRDHNEGDCRQASAQEASALEEKHGHFRSESLSPCISSIKLCGNDWRGGNRRQEWKRSKALCLKSEGSAFGPTTIGRSLQNSRRRAVTKGGDGCSPATKGRGTDEAVKSRTCKREDGKGWRCGNEAAPGSTLCEHHLSQVRSYSKRPSNSSSKRHSPSVQEGRRKRRPIVQSTTTTTTSADNDCYYYYYTGFGPAWRETKRKRVVAIAEEDGTDDDGGGGGTAADAAGGCRANGEGGEDGGKGKIKGRKRVKCRSLKSLL